MRSGFYLGLTLPLLLALAVNAYGLTTFGKSQNNNPNQQPNAQPPAPRGRDCQFEKDCNAINNTSCVPDPNDSQFSRCLCGDNKAPFNGICRNKFKGPNHACKTKEECIEGSECMTLKDEGTRGVAKVCKCSEGFTEVDFTCSSGVMMDGLSAMATVLLLALPVAVLTN